MIFMTKKGKKRIQIGSKSVSVSVDNTKVRKKPECKKTGTKHAYNDEKMGRRGYMMRVCICGHLQFKYGKTEKSMEWIDKKDMPPETDKTVVEQRPEVDERFLGEQPQRRLKNKQKRKKQFNKITYGKGQFTINGEVRTQTNAQANG